MLLAVLLLDEDGSVSLFSIPEETLSWKTETFVLTLSVLL